jgi:hypothetical protein
VCHRLTGWVAAPRLISMTMRGNMPTQTMTDLDRFNAVMEYQPVDRVPNWELGVWPQTRERWEDEGLDSSAYHWDWFTGEAALGMDPREFIRFNGTFIPPFDEVTLAEDERTVARRAHVYGHLHQFPGNLHGRVAGAEAAPAYAPGAV